MQSGKLREKNWKPKLKKYKTDLPNTCNQLIYNQIKVQSKKDSRTSCKLETITFSFSIWHSAKLPEATPLLYPLTRLEAQFVFSANQGLLVLQLLKNKKKVGLTIWTPIAELWYRDVNFTFWFILLSACLGIRTIYYQAFVTFNCLFYFVILIWKYIYRTIVFLLPSFLSLGLAT